LILRGKSTSRITITGGTHVSNSPSYHFLETTWVGYLKKIGCNLQLKMLLPGFYPRGGGTIEAVLEPAAVLRPIAMTTRPEITTAGGFSAVADLPAEIAKRQAKRLAFKLQQHGELQTHIPLERWENGPASVVAAIFRQSPVPTLFCTLGERGKPAERVADDAAEQAIGYWQSGAPVDPHSADQILLPLAFATGPSEFRTSEITQHLLTNASTIRKFSDCTIEVHGVLGEPGTINVVPDSSVAR
jgi:RNA 3'-terminal phosphate cyclase (ATP)